MISYKFPIYPNQEIIEKIEMNLELCRQLYNTFLETLNTPRLDGHKWRKYDTQKLIVQIKQNRPEYKQVHSKVLQMVNYTLWSNIKGFSELKKKGFKIGRLRFKGKGWYKTLNYNQTGFKLDIENGTIWFSKIGSMKCKYLREIVGEIKGIIIKRSSDGKYFAIIQTEQEKQPLPKTEKQVGIDVGINSFAVDSDGKSFENPKFIDQTFQKIKKEQQKLSRKKKGSSNRRKQKMKLAKLHEKVANQRRDYLHKISRYYVNNYDIICVEDLQIFRMTKSGKRDHRSRKALHRHILDASWGQFMNYLEYKAENADRQVIFVNPKNTTQRCSQCGEIVKKELSDRTHNCPYCKISLDRDYNASINILKAGVGHSSVPTELKPLFSYTSKDVVTGQVLAMT